MEVFQLGKLLASNSRGFAYTEFAIIEVRLYNEQIYINCETKKFFLVEMTSFYDEVEIEDMEYDEVAQLYHYPCPCGDRFEITMEELMDGEDIGRCPSCSLIIRVIYDPDDFQRDDDPDTKISLSTSIVV